jgi:hypothetical protein
MLCSGGYWLGLRTAQPGFEIMLLDSESYSKYHPYILTLSAVMGLCWVSVVFVGEGDSVFLESYGILRTRKLHPKPAENVACTKWKLWQLSEKDFILNSVENKGCSEESSTLKKSLTSFQLHEQLKKLHFFFNLGLLARVEFELIVSLTNAIIRQNYVVELLQKALTGTAYRSSVYLRRLCGPDAFVTWWRMPQIHLAGP